MGEYYLWANVDKMEYMTPSDFGHGSKNHESIHKGSAILAALRELLSDRWSGCQIIWLGDESVFPSEDCRGLFTKMRIQADELPYDIVLNHYTNVSGLFKAAEEIVREEIGYFLIELKSGNNDVRNEYGIDENNPYKGLFTRTGRSFSYVVNYSKKVCYSLIETDICFLDGSKSDYADPLSVLMGYGRSASTGEWVGDIIGVSDTIPEGIKMLKNVDLDW